MPQHSKSLSESNIFQNGSQSYLHKMPLPHIFIPEADKNEISVSKSPLIPILHLADFDLPNCIKSEPASPQVKKMLKDETSEEKGRVSEYNFEF